MNQTRQNAHMMPIRAPGIGSMSWKGHNQERSVDVLVAKTAAQPRRTPGRRVKKNPCVLAANTVRKSDMDTFRYSWAETHVQHQHRSSASNSTQQCCNAAHNGQVPLLRNLTCLHVIVGNGNDGSVVQDCDEDHCHHWEGKIPWNFVQIVLRLAFVQKPFTTHDSLWVNTHCRQKEEHEKLQRARNTVDNVVFHPLEDLPRQVNGF